MTAKMPNPFTNVPARSVRRMDEATFLAACSPAMREDLKAIFSDEHHFGDYITLPCTSLHNLRATTAASNAEAETREAVLALIDQAIDAGFTHLAVVGEHR